MPIPIALATWSGLPDLSPDCRHLLPALTDSGFSPRIVNWQAERPAGPVLIRSAWNYFRHRDDFVQWARSLKGPLLNGPDVVAWNSDKHYLGELAERGVNVVPSRFVSPADAAQVRARMREEDWRTVVVKPTVSAGAYRTLKLSAGFADFTPYETDVIVQPFLPEVERDGEWSFVLFAGSYSHHVLKRAKPGDFRVQDDHGGTVEVPAVDPGLVEAAVRVLQRSGLGDLAYARVDGVVCDGTFLLMELELIEPELFFRVDPDSPYRLCEVLKRRIEDNR